LLRNYVAVKIILAGVNGALEDEESDEEEDEDEDEDEDEI